ncbi:MAG: biphenyl 2,3-dioxygenase [Flavobacteriales bacterium]|nr:biphenyl 2,3-dioxygenase [Flavobacteriales bacterium]
MTVIEERNRDELVASGGGSPEKFAHIVLRTRQLPVMRDFYLTLLNARVAHEGQMAAFLRYDDEHHRVVILNLPHVDDVQHGAAGLEHFSFTYPTMGALLANYVRLKELGIQPDWCINHGFTTSIYYRDPDGNQIETQFDNMTMEEADEFMQGGYFDQNPIGVDFDREVLLARYRKGDPLEKLVQMKSAPYAEGVAHIRPPNMPPYDADGDLL